VRTAFVIVRGIDPSFGQLIDKLIVQLGDPSWKQREAATSELGKIGRVAKPKLEAALRSKDLEVVYRAEQLLAKLNPRPTEVNRR
jgi:hypothetical protein